MLILRNEAPCELSRLFGDSAQSIQIISHLTIATFSQPVGESELMPTNLVFVHHFLTFVFQKLSSRKAGLFMKQTL